LGKHCSTPQGNLSGAIICKKWQSLLGNVS
jgi:hypothetical protein